MNRLALSKLFQAITDEERERILVCSKAAIKQYKANHYIFEQGGRPSKLFLLLSGRVQIVKDFTSGKEMYCISLKQEMFSAKFFFLVIGKVTGMMQLP